MLHLFEELEKSTETGCWEYEIESGELFWSPQTYLIHAVEYSEKIDVESAINFYHKEDQAIIEAAFKRCLQQHQEFKLMLRIIDRNGELKFVESFGKPLFRDGKLYSVFGTFKNISTEVSLTKSKDQISYEFFNYKKSMNTFFIIAETDERGLITAVNDKFCEISKYTREELIGKNHRILNSGHHPSSFFKKMWETIQSGKPWEGQICNKNKDGDLYWVQTFIFPTTNDENKVIGHTAIRFDITDKKLLEAEIKEEKDKATFASQLAAVGEISAGIAHEIANPLTIILTQAKFINRHIDQPKKVEKIIANIEMAGKRIARIIRGLHHVAQRSRGDELYPTPLADIFANTLEFCEEALKNKHIELIYEIPSYDTIINCNDVKVSQILLNLINNAKDAIVESKTKDKWIKIIGEDLDDKVVIKVIDSGPGIPDNIKDKLMTSFFTTKPVGKGTGLGLALVQRFVSEHNGTVIIDKEDGNTCFIIELPKQTKKAA